MHSQHTVGARLVVGEVLGRLVVVGAGVGAGLGSGVGAGLGSDVGAGLGSGVGAGLVGAGVGAGVGSGVGHIAYSPHEPPPTHEPNHQLVVLSSVAVQEKCVFRRPPPDSEYKPKLFSDPTAPVLQAEQSQPLYDESMWSS